MSRIKAAFQNGKALIPFLTAGDPDLESTEKFIYVLAEAGADLIEIGIPFSDPIAEGPVIQAADLRSLNARTTIDDIFGMVKRVRGRTDIPLVFMGYLNLVFYYGYENFFTRCAEVGIDGIIVPDLPYEEKDEIEPAAAACGIEVISMVAPTSVSAAPAGASTAARRVQCIAAEATGFLYIVSSMGVTGVRKEIRTDLRSIVEAIRGVSEIPCAIGFGISTPE